MTTLSLTTYLSRNQIESLLNNACYESRRWCEDMEQFENKSIIDRVMNGDSVSLYCVDTEYEFNLYTIRKGLTNLGLNSPMHLGFILSDIADSKVSDYFMQCCLFGEVIFD